MEAIARHDQGVRRAQGGILSRPDDPRQVRMVAPWKALALLDHRTRDIDGVDTLDALDQMACQKARAAPHVEDVARLIDDERHEDVEDGRGVGRAMLVGGGDIRILKGSGGLVAEEVGFRLHLALLCPEQQRGRLIHPPAAQPVYRGALFYAEYPPTPAIFQPLYPPLMCILMH